MLNDLLNIMNTLYWTWYYTVKYQSHSAEVRMSMVIYCSLIFPLGKSMGAPGAIM